MRYPVLALPFLSLLGLFLLSGCNNTLNPLCSSARPAPVIGSLTPSTVTYSDVQQGTTLTVAGSNFVSSTQVIVDKTPLAANVVSSQKLTVKLGTDVISGPGSVKVMVSTPAGNTGDLGCSSGGTSVPLTLTVN